ncbi:ankyrin repeat domain-containing protein [Agrobacterium tumefaciens]|uniref:ankyrin repeat domain-containing protein n=1 Tax=Agrobacterium tumefaciens TaxID=358 RepID=UPI0009C03D25
MLSHLACSHRYTPLGLAVREGHAEIVHVILDSGADPRPSVSSAASSTFSSPIVSTWVPLVVYLGLS